MRREARRCDAFAARSDRVAGLCTRSQSLCRRLKDNVKSPAQAAGAGESERVQRTRRSLQGFSWIRRALRASVVACLAWVASATAAPGLLSRPAPDFALPSAGGTNVRLSEYRGQPVILSFWSSRCGRCAAQLSGLDRHYATYRSSGLVVLGISVDDDLQRAADYAHDHRTTFPLLLDGSKNVSRAFGIDRLPTTVLIDRSGIVRYLHADDRADDPSYVTQIRALLDDSFAAP